MRRLPVPFVALFLLMATLCLPVLGKTNLLILTVDDMSCDSVCVYGCRLEESTPNMDALARTALRFEYAHVQVGNCMPSRNVMWSGLLPHNNGVEGFFQVKDAKHPHLCDLAKEAGYFTAIRHKISHSTPYSPYSWDLELDQNADGTHAHVKDAESYGDSLRRAIDSAKHADKPFCAVINISDPHKPFYSQVKSGNDPHVPSRVFLGHEVPVPGFLPDDSVVREELALYYSSVRRADDGVGAVLRALDETGHDEDTLVMFLSDHGMPLPFAKTQLYHHSTRTPLMIRWPGKTTPNSVDNQHMVSAVDFIPTLCEALNLRMPEKLDGRSFAPILQGDAQSHRDFVIKEYNENSGSIRNPMRAIETKEYLYLFNPWSDGKLKMATATNGTQSWKRMKQLAASNTNIAARVELMEHRELEELYHIASDPDCLVNLINDSEHQSAATELRGKLLDHMRMTNDPVAELLAKREDSTLRADFMKRTQSDATLRKNRRKRNATSQTSPKPSMDLLKWRIADLNEDKLTIQVTYRMPKSLGERDLIVTLKSANNERLERQTVKIKTDGSAKFEFALPNEVDSSKLRLAAFVGKDYAHRLQYLQSTIGTLVEESKH